MPTFIADSADYLTLLDKILSKGFASTKICFDAVRGARRERFVPGCSVFMFAAPTSQWRFDKLDHNTVPRGRRDLVCN